MYESKKQYQYGTGRRKASIARVRVYEGGTAELPKQARAQFGVQVKLHVTRLVNKVDASVFLLITAWSQRTNTPSANTICAT